MISKKFISGETMDAQTHWENIYGTKAADAVSWYRPHLETSLELIEQAAPVHSESIIDIGGGESTLVDDLIGAGYLNVTVMDISRTAIEHSKKRVGSVSSKTVWLVADVTNAEFAKFVTATGYVTTAEKKPDWDELKKELPPDTPKPDDGMLVAGTIGAEDVRLLHYTDSVDEAAAFIAAAVEEFGVITPPTPLKILGESPLRR